MTNYEATNDGEIKLSFAKGVKIPGNIVIDDSKLEVTLIDGRTNETR